MKKIGFILIAIAVIVILYNTIIIPGQNENIAAESPFITIFSGGANLKAHYTFCPPYTGFEIFIFVMMITGGIMLFLPSKKSDSKE